MSRTYVARRAALAAPALFSTLFSAVLTVAVVTLWLGQVMPPLLALVIGLGFDGAWLSALAYERRLAAQGDTDHRVTLLGWAFGVMATAVLVVHALTTSTPAAWLAVSWLPLAAKALWWLHHLWEQTEISPRARVEISRTLQSARDQAAIARASLSAQAGVERVRMESLAAAGVTVARIQSRSAERLAEAWGELTETGREEGQAGALSRMLAPASPQWEVPVLSAAEISGGDQAESDRPSLAPQFSEAEILPALRAETEQSPARVPEQGRTVSVASAVRTLLSEGVDDPKAVLARLPEMTGRRPEVNSVKREIRHAKALQQAKQQQAGRVPFGFGGGR